MVEITVKITPPAGMTDAEALGYFCRSRGWTPALPETRNQFAKRILAEEVRQGIKQYRRLLAEEAINIPDDVVVD